MERKFEQQLENVDEQMISKFEEIKKLLENLSLSHNGTGVLNNGQK